MAYWDSLLGLSPNVLGDALGNGLSAQVLSASVTASTAPAPVPEPGTLLLLGSGLVGLVGWRKKGRPAA